MFGLIDLFA